MRIHGAAWGGNEKNCTGKTKIGNGLRGVGRRILGRMAFENGDRCVMSFLGWKERKARKRTPAPKGRVGAGNLLIKNFSLYTVIMSGFAESFREDTKESFQQVKWKLQNCSSCILRSEVSMNSSLCF